MSKPASDGPAIELVGLTKRFGKKAAVDRLQLTVPRGSVFGLLGSNGAGKSTTLKMLMGMLSITEGAARVLGQDVAQEWHAIRQRVGYVPEAHTVCRWMRVSGAIGFCRAQFAAWDAAKHYTGTARQPAQVVFTLQNEACEKCHQDAVRKDRETWKKRYQLFIQKERD